MDDDNTDRVHVPGQQPAPERDIEPLWPPETTAPDAAAPWAVGTPATVVPPATATGGVPAPRVGPPAPVDLDQPFTLDQPPPVPPRPAATGPADPLPPQAGGPPNGGAPPNGGGSPWAQPPQRPADGGEPAGSAQAPADVARQGPQPPAAPARPTAPPPAGPQTPHPGTEPQAPQPAMPTSAQAVPTPDVAPVAPVGPRMPDATPPAPPPTAAPHVAAEHGTSGAPATGPAYQAGEAAQGETGQAAPRLGPFPPAPGIPGYPPSAAPPGPAPQHQAGWYPPNWQPGAPGVQPVPQPPYQEAAGVTRMPAGQGWAPDPGVTPTAEDFARRRQAKPVDPVATMGVRAVVNRTGLLRLPPGRHEQEIRHDIEMVRRNFGGLRQVTVVNPKGGAGKTVAILLLAMTFGQKRGGYVLAWDNNETQGTLGMRAQQDFHSRTVRDMLRDLAQFQGAHGRVGDLSQYVRSQGEGMFDVLASDESATGGEMLTAAAFAEIREVVSRFYKLIFVDTGNNVRAQNWQAAMDATDQLVVTMSARNDSAETAARMLDHLEQSGRQRLVRQAVTVVSMPPSRKEIDLPAIQAHFAARTRAVLLAPYERLIDTGEPIRYGQLSTATRDAWLKIAASVAEGL
ncbi:chromosome partitioning protein [Micromonospora sp. NPDC050686]|uniref:MinD/ParA family ATP-binding protein n=1 Tax=Micromonospora sp. NPDC050686 TaxID=3154631 RepID=UPI0034040BB8